MVPSAYAVSRKHRALWATMNFLAERDSVGPRTKRWDRSVIKVTVDRRKLILEHQAADQFTAVFRDQVADVQDALGNQMRVEQAIQAGREALEKAYWGV